MFKFESSENSANNHILIYSAVLLLIISGFIIWSSQVSVRQLAEKSKNIPEPPKITGKSELTIDFGNNKKRIFEGEIVANETIFDVLVQASKTGGFSYKLDEKNNLAAIEGFIKSGNKHWQWYINGKKAIEPLNTVYLKGGDKILVKYE